MPHSALSQTAFNDPELCKGLCGLLEKELETPLRFMEVCGTHTVSIFRSGLRSILPAGITHLSGPGCPVCVTHDREIAACLQLAAADNVIIATFGDLMRVPAPDGNNLKKAQAEGANIAIVYSPMDALSLAKNSPDKKVIFLGVGFETTSPILAATIIQAQKEKVSNFFILPLNKLVPPALVALLTEPAEEQSQIDAFLLPGHVATITGLEPFLFLAKEYNKPAVVSGFTPVDILQSLIFIARMKKKGDAQVINQYGRAVDDSGNPKAQELVKQVFRPTDALWRGIGTIALSGLSLQPEFSAFNALEHLSLDWPDVKPIKGCSCGDVLKGRITPHQCALFAKACTPATPVGPCMVSTEGSCAAYYAYNPI